MTINRLGYLAGLAAFASTLAYDIVQILQIAGVLQFPLDEILIYATSLCIVIPLLLEMLALHYLTPADKRFWSHAALLFTTLYAVFVTANYVVQLATVIPARLAGLADHLGLLEQTPHSMFWDYDAIGYIAMGLAVLFAIWVGMDYMRKRKERLSRTALPKRPKPHRIQVPLGGEANSVSCACRILIIHSYTRYMLGDWNIRAKRLAKVSNGLMM